MDPPIGQSVSFSSPDRWTMGTLYFCEKLTGPAPTDAVVTWIDRDSTFVLRPKPESDSQIPGDTQTTKFHDANSSALWNIGEDTICKVKSWVEGMESEATTIQVVKENMPSIPIPEVIHSWVDEIWNRTFLLLKRVPGETIKDAWPKLSADQVEKIAEDVLNHIHTMTQFVHPQLQTVSGCGVQGESWLLEAPPFAIWPSWKPCVRPVFTTETFAARLYDECGEEAPDFGPHFHFYHPDMGPTNVFVSVSGPMKEDAQITAIIDWEAAAYWPFWYIALKPRVSAGFILDGVEEGHEWDWTKALFYAIFEAGYPCPGEWYFRTKKYKEERKEERLARLSSKSP